MDVHTHFQMELEELKENLLKMAALVEEAINNAVQSLVKRDSELAKKTLDGEDRINKLEIAIEDMCLKLLALRQPMASDLRFITSAMKIITDLERIGDQAVNIAERAVFLNEEPQLKPYIDIPRMAEIAQSMVKDVLDAFVNQRLQIGSFGLRKRRSGRWVKRSGLQGTSHLYDFRSEDHHEGSAPNDRMSMPGTNWRSCHEHR